MVIYEEKELLNPFISSRKQKGARVGFVPTMGALHQGHLSLVERALSENDLVVVSIFVNPTQFDNPQDLKKYPRIHEEDQKLLKTLKGEIVLFIPEANNLYGDSIKARRFTYDGLENQMEGANRKGHFDGVGTVLSLLFSIVEPHRAYFGEKDFQQLRLIQGMAEAFFLETEIIGCPIVREEDGLAMSSRNLNLSPCERRHAPTFSRILASEGDDLEVAAKLECAGFRIDYVKTQFGRRFGAVVMGSGEAPVRLIDNVELA